MTDEYAAYKLSGEPFPGKFGIFYKVNKPTKNANEAQIVTNMQEKLKGQEPWQILQKTFDRMK
jgi:2-oxoglutarate ferredoxin oxidoreductase subunit beta